MIRKRKPRLAAFRERLAGAGLGRRTQPADRVPLGAATAIACPHTRPNWSRSRPTHPGERYAVDDGRAAAGDPKRADRVRAGDRPGRARLGAEAWPVRAAISPASSISSSPIGTKWLEVLKQIAPRVTASRAHLQPGDRPVLPTCSSGRWRPRLLPSPSTPITIAARSAAELERAVDAFARTPNGGLWCCRMSRT